MSSIIFNRSLLCLSVLAFSVGAFGQDTAQSTSPAQDSAAEPAMVEDAPPVVPLLIRGTSNSLAFGPELERTNYVRGEIGVGTTYDDNSLNATVNPVGDLSYSVMPRITLDQTRSRLHWVMGYGAGLIVNQRLSERNQGSHSFNGDLQYRLSPHVTLHLSDAFSLSTGFFEQLQAGPGSPPTGPINQPNQTVLTPLARTLENSGSADLTYQFGADDLIGINGTSNLSRFADVPGGATTLIDSTSQEGGVFYSHRFTPRNWSGISFRYQRFTFDPGGEKAEAYSALLFHTIYLQPRMTLSFFAGPEYSDHESETVTVLVTPPLISLAVVTSSQQKWSASGGGSFGWQGARTSLRMNVVRKVSDGGGIVGAVHLISADAAVRRQLARSTAVNFGVIYGNNRALQGSSGGRPPFTSVAANAALEQKLGSNLMLGLGYARDYQSGVIVNSTDNINHNRGWVSLAYSFNRPWGR